MVYVLGPKLQVGQKILKKKCQSEYSHFLGLSCAHFSLVTYVHQLSKVLPQYHLVFNDLLETMFSTGNDAYLMISAINISNLLATISKKKMSSLYDDSLVYYPFLAE